MNRSLTIQPGPVVVARRRAILEFVERFVDETGFGVSADWVHLTLKVVYPVSQQAYLDELNLLTERGQLIRQITCHTGRRTNFYYPNEETHA